MPQQIIDTALDALLTFVQAEATLLEVGVNERSITHKMAEYLQRAFPEWHVDCEYNRLGHAVKRLPDPTGVGTDDTDGQTIFPDIIVHKRKERANLLVIEVKKTTNTREGDEVKLRGLTAPQGEYGYEVGLHIYVDCASQRLSSVVAYRAGDISAELSAVATAKLGLGKT